MEKSVGKRKPVLRIVNSGQVRRYAARLLNELRNGEITNESAAVQVTIVNCLLEAMKDQRANGQAEPEFEEV